MGSEHEREFIADLLEERASLIEWHVVSIRDGSKGPIFHVEHEGTLDTLKPDDLVLICDDLMTQNSQVRVYLTPDAAYTLTGEALHWPQTTQFRHCPVTILPPAATGSTE